MSNDLRKLGVSLFIWGMGEGLFLYIEPLYLRELGADPVAIGAILGSVGLAMAVSPIPAGFLADRFGHKTVMLAGWIMGIVTAVMMFAARSLNWFVVGLVTYSFTAFVMPAINAYTTQSRGKYTIERAITTVSAIYAAGTILSPALGGWIARAYGTRMVFGVSAVCFVLSTLAIMLLSPLPPSRMSTAHRYAPLFGNRRFLGFLALVMFVFVAIDVGLPFAPNFLADRHGLDVAQVGALGSVSAIGWVIISTVLGRRSPRRGFMAAQVLLVLSLVALLLGNAFAWFVLAYFLRGAFASSRSLASAQVGRVVNPPEMGMAFGLTDTVTSLAFMIAPAIAGYLYSLDPARPFQISLAAIGLALVLTWRFAPRPQTLPPSPASLESTHPSAAD